MKVDEFLEIKLNGQDNLAKLLKSIIEVFFLYLASVFLILLNIKY